MKYILLIAMLALSVSSVASEVKEVEVLITKLSDPDFEVRQDASTQLGKLGPQYIEKFVHRAVDSSDSEVKYRLFGAARDIYVAIILPEESKWLLFNGTLGLTGVSRQFDYHTNGEGAQEFTSGVLINCVGIDSPLKDKAEQYDIIVSIDGKTPVMTDEDLPTRAGKTTKITVRRYKDTQAIADRWDIPSAAEYSTLTFEVQANWKESKYIDTVAAGALIATLWHTYLVEHNLL